MPLSMCHKVYASCKGVAKDALICIHHFDREQLVSVPQVPLLQSTASRPRGSNSRGGAARNGDCRAARGRTRSELMGSRGLGAQAALGPGARPQATPKQHHSAVQVYECYQC